MENMENKISQFNLMISSLIKIYYVHINNRKKMFAPIVSTNDRILKYYQKI